MLGELDKTIACDISYSTQVLGYAPAIGLHEGMRQSHPLVPRAGDRPVTGAPGWLPERPSSRVGAGTSARCSWPCCATRAGRCGCSTCTTRTTAPPTSPCSVGDITEPATVRAACDGVDVVFHNVAQVPLARDAALFQSVNVTGTATLLDAAMECGVGKVVYTSSSAVFGVPSENPVTRDDTRRIPWRPTAAPSTRASCSAGRWPPVGWTSASSDPGRSSGHGRLGIFGILFDWIADGASVPVLGSGDNRYQFVHAGDLASACILAAARPGSGTYNIGSEDVQTMRQTLEHLCEYAGTGAGVRSVPGRPASVAMAALSRTGLAPFGPYHWMMYGREMWFDLTAAHDELGWRGVHDTDAMFRESYDWYLAHRDDPAVSRSVTPPQPGAPGGAEGRSSS